MSNNPYGPQKTGLMKIWSNLTLGAKIVSIVLVLGLFTGLAYVFAPGITRDVSKSLTSFKIDDTEINSESDASFQPLPELKPANVKKPLIRIAGYAWNGQSALISSIGGPVTKKGSFMEKNGLNVEFVKQDWLSELRSMQMTFVDEFHKGNQYPQSERSANFIVIMGDGAPFYISTAQSFLDKTYGKDKYHLVVVGAVGMSRGEDKVIGPSSWKKDPKEMIGKTISVVPGDGDWVTLLNYCFLNGLKVNPDFTTYDPDAVNIHPSANDDYIESAKELIKSVQNGYKVEKLEVINGKLTGKKVMVPIDGCATWTPGDQIVFDALSGFTDIASTKDFPNQMPTTIITLKEWAEKHEEEVIGVLKSSYEAANQIKKYDEWAKFAGNALSETYQLENGDYWYKMFKGETKTKDGVTYSVGGSGVLNYSDAMQYYGITDGVNRYKSVYNQVSNYLTQMNPFDFNSSVEEVVPFDKAVDLSYLKSIHDVETQAVEKIDYTTQRTEVMASGEWHINFATNSDVIQSDSYDELETVYNLLVQAENTKVTIVGHTDNTGSSEINVPLSKNRANSVSEFLKKKGIQSNRIQYVDGKGDSEPIGDNNTSSGKAKNRRVTITLLK